MRTEVSPIRKIVATGILAAAEIFSSAGGVSATNLSSTALEINDTNIASLSADCKYEDNLTSHRNYSDWRLTLLDTEVMVGRDYKPPDLVPVRNAGITGRGVVRSVMIDDLRSLAQAARENGSPIQVASAFRSYNTQKALFARYVRRDGFARAATYSARPGHSEHQLGTTIDFKTKGGGWPGKYSDWAKTPAGEWLKEHAWEHGFILSYPKDEKDVTCYRYESWHYRYFGKEQARQMHNSGLTTREFLKQLDNTPIPTPEPTPTIEPTPIPTLEPTPIPTPEPTPTIEPTPEPTPVSTPTIEPTPTAII